MMKVKELVAILSKLDQEAEICMHECYDGDYTYLREDQIKKIELKNSYKGYLLDNTGRQREGEIPLK